MPLSDIHFEQIAAAGLITLDRPDALNALRRGAIDKKELLALLKEAGCSKMGVRQKLATVLTCENVSRHDGATHEHEPRRCVCV